MDLALALFLYKRCSHCMHRSVGGCIGIVDIMAHSSLSLTHTHTIPLPLSIFASLPPTNTRSLPQIRTHTLSLSHTHTQGLMSGVVVDTGDGVTHVVPVYDGFVPQHLIRRLDVAGRYGILLTWHNSLFLFDLFGPSEFLSNLLMEESTYLYYHLEL